MTTVLHTSNISSASWEDISRQTEACLYYAFPSQMWDTGSHQIYSPGLFSQLDILKLRVGTHCAQISESIPTRELYWPKWNLFDFVEAT